MQLQYNTFAVLSTAIGVDEQFMKVELPALQKVISLVGGQRALARHLGVTQPTVSSWVNRDGRIGAHHAIPCDLLTGGAVSAHELRPDLYPMGIVTINRPQTHEEE